MLNLFVDALSENTKKIIAGRGVKSLFTDAEAPASLKSAFIEGSEQLSRATDPLQNPDIALGTVGAMENVGSKIAGKAASVVLKKYKSVENLFLKGSKEDKASFIKNSFEENGLSVDKIVRAKLDDGFYVYHKGGMERGIPYRKLVKQEGNELTYEVGKKKGNSDFVADDSPDMLEMTIMEAKNRLGLSNNGKTNLKTLVGGAIVGGAATALFTPSETEYDNSEAAKVDRIPQVVSTRSDLYSPINTLDHEIKQFGTKVDKSVPVEVRTAPKRLQETINSTYQNNPDLPKGILEAILMKESSMGKDATSTNSSIGAYAYLTGFTKIAKAELIKHNIIPDLNTPAGVLKATADYIKITKDIRDESGAVVHTYDNWTKWYNERYSSGKLKEEDIERFDVMMKYYASSN